MSWFLCEIKDKFVLSALGLRIELATEGEFVFTQDMQALSCWAGDPMCGYYNLYRYPDKYQLIVAGVSAEVHQNLPIEIGRELWKAIEVKAGLVRG